jgi:hypothetical protein
MGTSPLLTRSQQSYYKPSVRRRQRSAKRLKFLLLGLKIINAFGPPVEKLMIALIQECIAQIWPEPPIEAIPPDPLSPKRTTTVSLAVRPGKGPSI